MSVVIGISFRVGCHVSADAWAVRGSGKAFGYNAVLESKIERRARRPAEFDHKMKTPEIGAVLPSTSYDAISGPGHRGGSGEPGLP
jgi:hypothetical protein